MHSQDILRYIKKHYRTAIIVASIAFITYGLGGFLMYLLCMGVVAEMQISVAFWLIPCFIVFVFVFVGALLFQRELRGCDKCTCSECGTKKKPIN